MYLGAGQATGVSSIGGSIDLEAGDSASKGGDVHVLSGSGEVTSGKISIASNAAMAGSTSGDFLISSGLSSGGGKSGAGTCGIVSYHFGAADLYHGPSNSTISCPCSGDINRKHDRVNSGNPSSEGWDVKPRPRWKC